MPSTIRLQEWTKHQLDELHDIEDHSSHDSVIKSLLKYRELYLLQQDGHPAPITPTDTTRQITPNPVPDNNWGAALYAGKIGCGKTVAMRNHAHHLTNDHPPTDVIFIDPLSGNEAFATAHNGTTATIDAETPVNPFDIPPVRRENTANPLVPAKRNAEDFLAAALLERDYEITTERDTVIETVVATIYDGITVTPHTASRTTVPTMDDVFEVLEDMQADPDAYTQGSVAPNRISEHAATIEDALYPFREGGDYEHLNGYTAPALYEAEFLTVTFDTTTDTATMSMLAAAIAARTAGAYHRHRTAVFIDEAHYMVTNPAAKRLVNRLTHTAQSGRVSMRYSVQTTASVIGDMHIDLRPYLIRAYLFRHEEDTITSAMRNAFDLSDSDVDYLLDANLGTYDEDSVDVLTVRADEPTLAETVTIPDDVKETIFT